MMLQLIYLLLTTTNFKVKLLCENTAPTNYSYRNVVNINNII